MNDLVQSRWLPIAADGLDHFHDFRGTRLKYQLDNLKYEFILLGMKIGERGQVTIPQKYRSRFGLTPATEVEFFEQAGHLILKKAANKTHPIGKYVEVLKGGGLRSDNLVEAMRGR